MKKICIALDTSPSAEKIANIGYNYAKALNAELTIIHVVDDTAVYAMDYDPIMNYDGFLIRRNIEFAEDIKEEAQKFLTETTNFLGDPTIKTKVFEGDTYDAIMEFCKISTPDLLVVGTHSHSALENLLIGNVATKIVNHSEVPILVIPTKQ